MTKNDKKKEKISLEDIKIVELLKELDKKINPFDSSEWETLQSKEYNKETKLFHRTFNEEIEVTIMQSNQAETWMAFEKDGNQTKYTIDYIEPDGKNIQIEHASYTDKKGRKEENLKLICLYEDIKDPRNLLIEYNISKYKIVKKSASKKVSKKILIEELQTAITKADELTEEITNEKECNVKKYTRQ